MLIVQLLIDMDKFKTVPKEIIDECKNCKDCNDITQHLQVCRKKHKKVKVKKPKLRMVKL